MDDTIERRKHKRFIVIEKMAEPVEIHFISPVSSEPIMGQITDISAGGMGLIVDEPLPESSVFSLYIRLRGIKPFEAKGKTVWLKKNNGNHIAGISFTEIEVADVRMLNQIAEDYDNCSKTRRAGDKNFCFDKCLYSILCDKKPESVQIQDTEKKVSKIDVKDVKKEIPSKPADQTANIASDEINAALKAVLPSGSSDDKKSESSPQFKASSLDETIKLDKPPQAAPSSIGGSQTSPSSGGQVFKSSLDETVKMDAPIKPVMPTGKPSAPPPSALKPAEPVKPPEKPAQVFKSSLDETVKMDAPIKPVAP
ncbi:MAG: PilZ domain-containing protein, partial [Elusimicrobia bacterium]|nr:PilZ domain-containing protein [Elusimicrobiota bacterium]